MKNLNNRPKSKLSSAYTKLKKGDEVVYTRHFMFGKTSIETAKVVMVDKWDVLLDNGDVALLCHYYN